MYNRCTMMFLIVIINPIEKRKTSTCNTRAKFNKSIACASTSLDPHQSGTGTGSCGHIRGNPK